MEEPQRRNEDEKELEEDEVARKHRKSGMGGAMLRLLAGTAEVRLYTYAWSRHVNVHIVCLSAFLLYRAIIAWNVKIGGGGGGGL